MKSLGFLGLVFDTGLSVTPLMGHLGCLESHRSVPVVANPSNLNVYVCGGVGSCIFVHFFVKWDGNSHIHRQPHPIIIPQSEFASSIGLFVIELLVNSLHLAISSLQEPCAP